MSHFIHCFLFNLILSLNLKKKKKHKKKLHKKVINKLQRQRMSKEVEDQM